MSRMTAPDWAVYAVLREVKGRAYAESYRHKRNKKNAELGIGLRKEEQPILVKDYGMDGILTKQFIPGELGAEDKAAIEDCEWIEITHCAYDCTGRPFTNWIKFFKVPGGYWMYHSVGFDV